MKPTQPKSKPARVHVRCNPDLKRDIHLHAVRTGTTITQLTLDFYRDTLKASDGLR